MHVLVTSTMRKVCGPWPAVLLLACSGLLGAGGVEAELPLPTTRTISFETDEGTLMSPDVSPDGEIVVFDLLGDLYTVPLAGGHAAALTSGPAIDSRPKYSPDGRWIIFVSDRSGESSLWVVSPDGSDLRDIVKAPPQSGAEFFTPEWAPDGNTVYAGVTTGAANYLVRVPLESGIPETILTRGPDAKVGYDPVPGPEPGEILFSRLGVVEGGIAFDGEQRVPNLQLARLDVASGRAYPLTASPGGAMVPALSRDGRWLAYTSRNGGKTGVRIRDLVSEEDSWLVPSVDRDQMEGGHYQAAAAGYDFLPDGSALVLSFGGGLWRAAIPDGTLTEIPFRARVKQELGPLLRFGKGLEDGDSYQVRHISNPTLSSDAGHVVFTALNRLWHADLAGCRREGRHADCPLRRLTKDEGADTAEDYPVFTPDGEAVVYSHFKGRSGQLRRVALRPGSRSVRLTEKPGYYVFPAFLGDGSGLVAVRLPAGRALFRRGVHSHSTLEFQATLVRVDTEEGSVSPLRPLRNLRTRPAGVKGSSRVYFFGADEGLASVARDGSDFRMHLRFDPDFSHPDNDYHEGEAFRAHAAALSPDGRSLLLEAGFSDIYRLNIAELAEAKGRSRRTSVLAAAADGTAARLSDDGGLYPTWSASGDHFAYSLGTTVFVGDALEPDGNIEAFGFNIEMPRRPPDGALLLKNARILTMADAGTIERGDILIRGRSISDVGTDLRAPDDALVLDMTGKTVMPGFVDSHCHIVYAPRLGNYVAPPGMQSWREWNYLAYGITTCFDPYPEGYEHVARIDAIETGLAIGPRIVSTGAVYHWQADPESEAAARALVRRNSEYYRFGHIKEYLIGSRLERQRLAAAAAEQRVNAVSETFDYHFNLSRILDGYSIAHFMPTKDLFADFQQLLVRSGSAMHIQFGTLRFEGGPSSISWFLNRENVMADDKLLRFAPEGYVRNRYLLRHTVSDVGHAFPAYAETLGQLERRGARLGIGDHGEWLGIGYHWELEAAASGMEPSAVLRLGTRGTARSIGLDGSVGSLEAGKLADLLVLEADPSSDIRNTRSLISVMKDGRLYDSETLREIWPEQKEAAAPWWTREATN